MAIDQSSLTQELCRLQDSVTRLSSLIEVGAIISSSLDLDEVLRLVMSKAQEVMTAQSCSILLVDEEGESLKFILALGGAEETATTLKKSIRLKMGQGVAGWCAQHCRSVLVEDARKDERYFAGADKVTGFSTRSLLAAPLINKDQLIGVAEVINPLEKEFFDGDDLLLFETFCRQVAIAIDNARYHQAYLAQQRTKEQLAAAAAIQESFLPPPLAENPDAFFSIKAKTLPALVVGGDLYDYFPLPGARLAVFIGDVSGKGVGAAIYMARVVSEFRYLARLLEDPAQVMTRLNQSLCQGTGPTIFVTAYYLLVSMEDGLVSLCNSGHLPPLLHRGKGGEASYLEEGSGLPLGLFQEAEYTESYLQLEAEDSLLLYTDGVMEAQNAAQELFGLDRLLTLAQKTPKGGGLLAAVLESVREYTTGLPPSDDLTLVELVWHGPCGKKTLAKDCLAAADRQETGLNKNPSPGERS